MIVFRAVFFMILLSPEMIFSQSGYGLGYGLGSYPFIFLIVLVVIVLIVRIFGAWMLRINDVISELKGIKQEIKLLRGESSDNSISNSFENKSSTSNKPEQVYSEDNLQDLKKNLLDDEIIILIKQTLFLKVIKKSEHENNKELHLTKGYTIIDANE